MRTSFLSPNRLATMGVVLSILLGAALSEPANKLPPFHSSALLNDEEKITPTVSVNKVLGPDGKLHGFWRIDWRIDKPNVKQRMTSYEQIRFQPGDRVTVQAGGCVQTGGHGNTWKRYVNPSGGGADHLYHGLIWIPGLIGARTQSAGPPGAPAQKDDLKRIAGYVNHTFPAPPDIGTAPNNPTLILGYEDDGYGDNGYYAHDDGTENQCQGVGNAFVIITIERALPEGSMATLQGATTTYGYEFDKTAYGAYVRTSGGGGVTGIYNCSCTKGYGTCELAGGGGAIYCKPGPAGPYQSPSVPICSATCIAVPSRNR
jgi:hypothetical protein